MKVTETWNGGRQSTSYFQAGKLLLNETSGGGSASRTDYVYDAAGQEVENFRQVDTNGDGVFDSSTRTLKTWDSGRLATETQLSPDYNGDGIEGDYTAAITYGYDGAGRLTAREEKNFAWGQEDPSAYRLETWDYGANGTLSKTFVEDTGIYNNPIIRTYTYKNGLLQNIKEQNENRYGDSRARTDESFTYNKDGTLKTKTDWADHCEFGWFQRVDTAYSRSNGYERQEIKFDFEGDFDPERVKLVETWKDAGGNATHVLTTHDVDGNGTWDSRDLIVRAFNEYGLASETVDYGADGTIEASYLKIVEPDYVLA